MRTENKPRTVEGGGGIPKGYRKLRRNEPITNGDMWFWCDEGIWVETEHGQSYTPYQMNQVYIRKVSPVKRRLASVNN